MHKFILLIILMVTISPMSLAEGALNMSGQLINSRIFSTQAAHQYETLERDNYQNSAIMQIEEKNYQPVIYKKQPQQEPTEQETKSLKNLFKGFRIIY